VVEYTSLQEAVAKSMTLEASSTKVVSQAVGMNVLPFPVTEEKEEAPQGRAEAQSLPCRQCFPKAGTWSHSCGSVLHSH
jgi:hypothetical protein